MQTRLLLAVSFLAASLAAGPFNQTVTIHGRVTDAAGQPLTGANVVVPSAGISVGANAGTAGAFSFSLDQATVGDSVAITARRIGYRPKTISISLKGKTDVVVDFVLQPDVSALSDVVVTGASVFSGKVSGVKGGTANGTASLRAAVGGGLPYLRRERGNTESYSVIDDNPYFLSSSRPLSTFSVDVDRASYSNVRRYFRDGKAPPKDAVRIEELINYFPYAYPEPRGSDPVSIVTNVGVAPWNSSHRLVMIGLKARSIPTASLPPNNLVFLIDVSGSMMSPDKLPLVKSAFEMLVSQLRPQDRVAIVVYAGAPGLVLPSTSGANKSTILEAITALEAGGSTAGGAGIRLAYKIARENFDKEGNNRVILATDGDFNVGESSDAEMVRLIEQERESGVFLSVLGFGQGNIKDSKMEQMADKGNGHFAYIDDLLEAKKTFVTEFGGTLRTVAKDVKLQVEFNPSRVAAYRLIGYENRLLNDADFADDTKDAGDMGSGHTVTALYEVIPVGASKDPMMPESTKLRYSSTATAKQGGKELLFVKLRYKQPESSRSQLMSVAVMDDAREVKGDFAFASAVAEFGMLLRQSKYRGSASYEDVLSIARRGQGGDSNELREGFMSMVKSAQTLTLASQK